MRKHVQRLLNAQRDLLSAPALGEIQLKINELNAAIDGGKTGAIRIKTEELQFAGEKWIKSYPNAAWRENVEVLLVALAVAMAIRTFFLQPFKIPTGSMQPTLFGVVSKNYLPHDGQPGEPNFKIPTGLERVKEWFQGISYIHIVAQSDGAIDSVSPLVRFLIFNIKQTVTIGGVDHVVWFPPDLGEQNIAWRAGLSRDHLYHKGDDVVKLRVDAGDHLFVDRISYNFRPPARGDIVVFETRGIAPDRRMEWHIPDDQFYIKRLVGLGGETLSVAQDYQVLGGPQFGGDVTGVGHLVVNGQPLSVATPHFENLYSFPGIPTGAKTITYQDNHYYGHALLEFLSPGSEFQIPTNHYFVMGDNTLNSQDSRFFGAIPNSSIIGKSLFVYWPITSRFGLGTR